MKFMIRCAEHHAPYGRFKNRLQIRCPVEKRAVGLK